MHSGLERKDKEGDVKHLQRYCLVGYFTTLLQLHMFRASNDRIWEGWGRKRWILVLTANVLNRWPADNFRRRDCGWVKCNDGFFSYVTILYQL
jgi:hypothetical protein